MDMTCPFLLRSRALGATLLGDAPLREQHALATAYDLDELAPAQRAGSRVSEHAVAGVGLAAHAHEVIEGSELAGC